MTTTPTLTIEAPDGTERATLEATTARYRSTLTGDRASGEATVMRSEWQDAAIAPTRHDRVTITAPDGEVIGEGLYADRFFDDQVVRVDIDSPERAGEDVQPTGVVERRVSESDATIVSDVIAEVPAWGEGTIEELSEDVTLSFSLAARDKQLRDVQEATGGELSFDGFSVDYVERLGADRSTVLSPASGHVTEAMDVVRDAGTDATHVLVVGSLDSPDTRVVLVAPEDDPRDHESNDNYQKVVRYDAPVWSSAEDDAWRQYGQNESVELGRLGNVAEQIAERLADESEHITVETELSGLDVSVGDRFSVDYPQRDLDRELRVIEAAHVFDEGGESYEVTLSNRTPVRDGGERRERRTLSALESGYQGFVDRSPGIGAGNWQLVEGGGSEVVAELPYRYPDDVVDELSITLDVAGRAWRSPVADDGHSHTVELESTTEDNADFQSVVQQEIKSFTFDEDDGSSWQSNPDTESTIDAPTSEVRAVVWITSDTNQNVALHNKTSGERIPLQDVQPRIGLNLGDGSIVLSDPTDCEGETFEIQTRDASSDGLGFVRYFGIGQHTHDIDATDSTTDEAALTPTVVESFDGEEFYPAVDIAVNGETIATDVGDVSGEWSATLDEELLGVFEPGRNEIVAHPVDGSRGEVQLALSTEYVRSGDSGA